MLLSGIQKHGSGCPPTICGHDSGGFKIGCSITAGKKEVPQKNKGRETDNPLN